MAAIIKPFSQLTKRDGNETGGKGASLGEMIQAGLPVPPGFVVLTAAFNQFVKELDLGSEIQAQLDQVNQHKLETVESASEHIQSLIIKSEIPTNISEAILTAFDRLGSEYVAVRSSATAEDGVNASWAGELDTFLNTRRSSLIEKVQHCWASLFTTRAIFYRFEKDFHQSKVSMAVVIQKMVQSEVSGVAFSVHPVTKDPTQIIIEAGYGLGEVIVSGAITPDHYLINKQNWSEVNTFITHQESALYQTTEGGNRWQDVPAEKRKKRKLSSQKTVELAKLVVKIEQHYGFPCDIEWALEDGKLFIVQSRPITTLQEKSQIINFDRQKVNS